MTQDAVAILYQALPPPVIDGLRKDAKPGGYSDGGADIAFVLRGQGHHILTPVADPDPTRPLDWVFPDTEEGIAAAMAAGATILWANSVLFEGHPLEAVVGQVRIVGQLPELMQRYDDKFATNRMLEQAGLPVARSFLMAQAARPDVRALAEVEAALADAGLSFPLIVKPVRGRGSQGVSRVADLAALRAAAAGLIEDAKFGDTLIVEEYLAGEEVTVTVMPPVDGTYRALRPVRRFDQKDGVAPYNGDVAVTANSAAIGADELASPAVQAMLEACVRAAALVGARAPIRIDCRADAAGRFTLFDLNMKPNMTGPGRPGRDHQDCLSAIAARAEGWDFPRLLEAMLAAAW
ncbi:biotin carboxylase [Sphingobium lactosutens]|uniref:ATP-binding protein n=1 Tax=Sphingobium lactosutens TaxID=522773 RepID=UPI0015BEBE3C|nr:biotin carboxylase [Sphingobium lactosutens]NWK95317.1 biotin carboxylase [Sphingobium lactosutens]